MGEEVRPRPRRRFAWYVRRARHYRHFVTHAVWWNHVQGAWGFAQFASAYRTKADAEGECLVRFNEFSKVSKGHKVTVVKRLMGVRGKFVDER